jgi:sn-glycerol 3-phosphate transport system permease protein
MNSRNWIYAWLMLLPAFVFLIAFTHLPAVTTLFDSFFTTAKGRRPAVFTGLGNYQKMLEDPIFVKAMVNSAIYAAITIPASIALSLAMALMVHRAFRGVSLMRMAFFTPTVLPLIAVANIWLFFYAPGFG